MKKIIQLRIRKTKGDAVHLSVPGSRFDYRIHNRKEIKSKVQNFFHVLKTQKCNLWDDLKIASINIQKAIFTDDKKFEELSEILNSNKYIIIHADKQIKDFLNIPWELLRKDAPSETEDNLWGLHYSFQRKSSDMDGASIDFRQKQQSKPSMGVIKYDHLPYTELIKNFLHELEDHDKIFYFPCQITGASKDEWIKCIKHDINRLNIAHLACLLVKFLYHQEPYLLLSDECLLSLRDIKNLSLNRKTPIIILDVIANSDSKLYIEQRNLFLSNIIKWGGSAVITSFYPTPNDFAVNFYCQLHKNLAENAALPIQDLLYKTRVEKFQENPLSLLFWLYGNMRIYESEHKSYDIDKLSNILAEHSDDFTVIDRWIEKLKQLFQAGLLIDSYQELEGSSKADKIFYLSKKIKTYGESYLLDAINLYIELRPADEALRKKITLWKEESI